MTCGSCSAAAAGAVVVTSRGVRLPVLMAQNAAACLACPWRIEHCGRRRCGASGRPTREHWRGGLPCPTGRHGRTVTWWGIRHAGLPKLVRWRLRRHRLVRELPRCGCVVAIKAAVLRLWRRARHAVEAEVRA